MQRKRLLLVWLLIGIGFVLNGAFANRAFANPSAVESPLPTIVSTYLCADQLALSLAAPEQILSVSYKSQDKQRSRFAEYAGAFPGNRGSSEEIIQIKPDIVLASRRWRQHPQQQQFDTLGIKVIVVPVSKNWQAVFDDTQRLADQLGRSERGKALVAQVKERLNRVQQATATDLNNKQTLLFFRPNGGSAGNGTHIDMLIQALGFKNYAAEIGLKGWGQISLENIIMQPPDLFLLSSYVRDNAFAKSQLSRHPLLQALLQHRPALTLPGDHGSCASWQIIETAEFLADQLSGLDNRPRPSAVSAGAL